MRKRKLKVWLFEVTYADGFKEKIVDSRLDDLAMVVLACWDEIADIKEIKEVKK